MARAHERCAQKEDECFFSVFILNPLTSEVKLLYWLATGGLFVLVVGDGGVLEHKPVLFVRPQGESLRPLNKITEEN